MRFVASRISFSEIINRSKLISFVINLLFNLLFSVIRKICKLVSYTDGGVVIISLHRLGDTIFTIPAIREVQKNNNSKITIACYTESVPIYKIALNGIHYCEFKHTDFYFNDRFAKIKARKKLKKLKPEKIIDLLGSMTSASLIFNLRAKEIIGMNRSQFKSIYDNYAVMRESPQLKDIYLDVVSLIAPIPERNELYKISKAIHSEGRILIHPFAAWSEKEWNLKKFFELGLKLKNYYKVLFILPKSNLDIDIISEIRFAGMDIIETKSVDELIQNLRDCSFFIGNDSGPVNIANFIGKPTFTIYGATNPDFTSTFQEHQQFIQKKLICSATENEKFCLVGGAEYICSGVQCMGELTLNEVFDSIKPLVKKYCQENIE